MEGPLKSFDFLSWVFIFIILELPIFFFFTFYGVLSCFSYGLSTESSLCKYLHIIYVYNLTQVIQKLFSYVFCGKRWFSLLYFADVSGNSIQLCLYSAIS